MKKPILITCECQGNHEPGCLLALRLSIKYGDREEGIMGIADLTHNAHIIPEEAECLIDEYVEKLASCWRERGQIKLAKDQAGWLTDDRIFTISSNNKSTVFSSQ